MDRSYSPTSARVVNRTHRAVRERALQMNMQRDRNRSLFLPLIIGSGLLLIAVFSTFTMLMTQYDVLPDGLPDANEQLLVHMLWFVPVTAAVLAVVLFRRGRINQDNEALR